MELANSSKVDKLLVVDKVMHDNSLSPPPPPPPPPPPNVKVYNFVYYAGSGSDGNIRGSTGAA